jgi:uncharacterized cupin superfamily protein
MSAARRSAQACTRFKVGTGDAHCLMNETAEDVVYLEIGDRTAGAAVEYPDDDLAVVTVDGKGRTAHENGSPYRSAKRRFCRLKARPRRDIPVDRPCA